MSDLLSEHEKMRKLVETGVLIPGIYEGKVGNMSYDPISKERYIELLESGYIQGISYNTRTMGRGIFTLGNNGEIINFKGVDSHLKDEDSISVTKTEFQEIKNVNNRDSHGINIIYFIDRSSGKEEPESRLEFRMRGVSQYQNVLAEKIKRDLIEIKDEMHLVKLPRLDMPVALSQEMCEKYDLPRNVPLTEEFVSDLEEGSYAKYCVDYLKKTNQQLDNRCELWQEYFERRYPEFLEDESMKRLVDREDKTYGLGAMFAQTTRVLENPFRIMDLDYFVKQANDKDAVKAIIDYSSGKCEGEFLEEYAVISAKNVAGFMKLNLSISNFEHRQDFPLSGEVCDDAFDDITSSILTNAPDKSDEYKLLQYYNQVYVFASNMKVIEDAYNMIGKPVPENYQDKFLQTFFESVKDKSKIRKCFEAKNPMDTIKIFDNAGKNFEGFEEYVSELREKAVQLYKDNYVKTPKSTDDDQGYERL